MNIGITQRIITNEHGVKADSIEHDYLRYYSQLGLNLIPIPNIGTDVLKVIDKFNIKGFILTGGGDINPKMYGHKDYSDRAYQDERDALESIIISACIDKNLPVLGECRGAQFINVFFAGSLIQDIDRDINSGINHVAAEHEINIIDENFKKIFSHESLTVNSYHKQGLTRNELSKLLVPFAETADGIIEGFYHPQKPIVGIMWHPERKLSATVLNSSLIHYLFEE